MRNIITPDNAVQWNTRINTTAALAALLLPLALAVYILPTNLVQGLSIALKKTRACYAG